MIDNNSQELSVTIFNQTYGCSIKYNINIADKINIFNKIVKGKYIKKRNLNKISIKNNITYLNWYQYIITPAPSIISFLYNNVFAYCVGFEKKETNWLNLIKHGQIFLDHTRFLMTWKMWKCRVVYNFLYNHYQLFGFYLLSVNIPLFLLVFIYQTCLKSGLLCYQAILSAHYLTWLTRRDQTIILHLIMFIKEQWMLITAKTSFS